MSLTNYDMEHPPEGMSQEEIDRRIEAIFEWDNEFRATHLHQRYPKYEDTLYHYTGVAGLIGIIRGGKIWATHMSKLNDQQEYLLGKAKVIDIVDSLPLGASSPLFKAAKSQLDKKLNTYVACYSTKHNLLSQWRAYSNQSQGYCLAFDTSQMVSRGDKIAVLEPVSYSAEMANDLIPALIESTNNLLLAKKEEIGDVEAGVLLGIIRTYLHFFACAMKDSAFVEEHEYRHICQPDHLYEPAPIKFRQGVFGLTPYVEISFPKDGKLPLKSVTIGPCHDFESEKSVLEILLNDHGYGDVEIKNSEIPLRLAL